MRASLAGILAAALGLATTELAAGILPGGRSPFAAVADQAIELLPASVVGGAIETLGTTSRSVLLIVMLVVAGAAGSLIGSWSSRWSWAAPVGFAPFVLVGIAAGTADPLLPTTTAIAAPLVGAATGMAALGTWRGVASRPPTRTRPDAAVAGQRTASRPSDGVEALQDPAAPPTPSRREALTWIASVGGAAAVFAVTGRTLQGRTVRGAAGGDLTLPVVRHPLPPPPPATTLDVDGLTPLLTPNAEFFRIDTAFLPPRIRADAHLVRITGLVDRPYELSYGELLALADTEVDVTLTCVSNEVGGELVGTARWLGVPLVNLLDRAGVQPGATQVVGRAVDGWTAGFPIEVLDGRPALVAVGMNGEPLPIKHGFPVRLVIAGLYGYVSDTKWLEEIELTTFDAYDAYWVRRGWAREGPIKAQSRIDVPRDGASVPAGTTTVAGVAWAGERGIAGIEVAVDDGTWRPAELAGELAPATWRQWRFVWEPGPGQHTLRVRATDGDGQVQTDQVSPPAPDGATGHHTIRVTVA